MRASKATVEKENQINDWEILCHNEDLENIEGYLLICMEDKENDIWKQKHVEIIDDKCQQHRYYFQHKWLPDNAWFRLNPVYEKIAQYVKIPEIPTKTADFTAYLAAFEKMALGNTVAAE
jgi:hypothetical protein